MQITKRLLFLLLPVFFASLSDAQNYALLDASHIKPLNTIPLPFNAVSPAGVTLSVNNRYFEKDGKPWFPLMGEFHYTRYPEQYWEEEILKMKAGGLNIIATYVFWNAHENPQGTWDWTGIRDLRRFTELCRKHGMFVWLRIGPWCHGEQVYGGHPTWINSMKGKRSNDQAYLAESQKLFDQIGQQTAGLYFKDGGPVIGVQLENEFASGDPDHIGTLKQMALKAGITPAYFSITCNTVFDEHKVDVIPLQGAYPYRGWEKAGGGTRKEFLYGSDEWILEDILGKLYYTVDKYPKGLCEQGCGSQMTYRNRFIVEPFAVEAHLQNQVGRGLNMVGYYMYHGGTQMPGLKEPGYPESYDFQSPVSEFGYLNQSYKNLKVLHNFLNDFGNELAAMQVVEAPDPCRDEKNLEKLRYIARTNGRQGFVFLCNSQARTVMPDKEVALRVKLPGEVIDFPPFTMKGQTAPILPFNLEANGILLKYVLAQPLARINDGENTTLFLTQLDGVTPQIAVDATTIKTEPAEGWTTKTGSNNILCTATSSNTISLTSPEGKTVTLIFLTRLQAEHSWRVTLNNKPSLIISEADVIANGENIELYTLNKPDFLFSVYPQIQSAATTDGKPLEIINHNGFSDCRVSYTPVTEPVTFKKKKDKAIITMPGQLSQNMNDIFVESEYYGGQVNAIQNEKTVTDNLYNGQPWLLGLKRYLGKGDLTLQVQPWNDKITGVNETLVNEIKKQNPGFKTLKLIPQYKTTLIIK